MLGFRLGFRVSRRHQAKHRAQVASAVFVLTPGSLPDLARLAGLVVSAHLRTERSSSCSLYIAFLSTLKPMAPAAKRVAKSTLEGIVRPPPLDGSTVVSRHRELLCQLVRLCVRLPPSRDPTRWIRESERVPKLTASMSQLYPDHYRWS